MDKSEALHTKILDYIPKLTKDGNKDIQTELMSKILLFVYPFSEDDEKENRSILLKIKEYVKTVENHYPDGAFIDLNLFIDSYFLFKTGTSFLFPLVSTKNIVPG